MRKFNLEKPIRVAEVIGKYKGGGVESFTINYYKNVDRTKVQFDFIFDSDSKDIPIDEIEKLGGKVILIPPYQHPFKYHKELKEVLRTGNYKIVHSHINTLSVFSLYAAKKAGVPIRIAHSHATTNKKEFIRNLVKLLLRPFNKMLATNYACCSESAGRWMFGNKNYDEKKVVKINNAIEVDKFIYNKKIRDEYRKKLGIKENQIVIGHVGRMVKTKNHSFLINVFFKICSNKDAILLLIGQGPLEVKLKQQVESLGIKDRVIFLGQKNDIYNWYQTFDAFVLPSLYEGFGMALLEAQVSNLPCIASLDVPNESKLIDDFKFLSLNDSYETWANSILKLVKNNERKSNKEIIVEKGYDISNENKKLTDYYINLIEEEYHADN